MVDLTTSFENPPLNGTVIAAMQYPNQTDSYLWLVLVKLTYGYVVWTHNDQDGGYHWGHYFTGPQDSEEVLKSKGYNMFLIKAKELIHREFFKTETV